jgi:hypothetical protein
VDFASQSQARVYPEQPRKYGFRCQQYLAKVVLLKKRTVEKRLFLCPNFDDSMVKGLPTQAAHL